MNGWNGSRGTCALLVILVAIEGGCWGRKFFRMPTETLEHLGEGRLAPRGECAAQGANRDDRADAAGGSGVRAGHERAAQDGSRGAQGPAQRAPGDAPRGAGELSVQAGRAAQDARAPIRPARRAPRRRGAGSDAGRGLRGVARGHARNGGGPVDPRELSSRASAAHADTAGALAAPAPPPEELYRQIYLDFSRREYQLALEESESFLAEYPDDPLGEEVLFIRGQCLMEPTGYIDALKEFSTLLQRYPRGKRAPGALLRMAVSYDAMGQKELAAGRRETSSQGVSAQRGGEGRRGAVRSHHRRNDARGAASRRDPPRNESFAHRVMSGNDGYR